MADETQVAETTPAPAQTEVKATEVKAPPTASTLGEQKLTLTVAEWQKTQDQLRELSAYKSAEAERMEKKEAEKLKLLGEKEGVDKALNAQRETLKVKEKEWADKYGALHQTIANEKVDAVISQAIAGRRFIGQTDEIRAQAAQDFQAIVRADGRFSAVQDAQGKWSVRETATGRDATEVLAEVIKAKSYLFAADTNGGVGNGGGAAGGDNAKPEGIEAFGRAYQAEQAKLHSFGLNRLN